MSTHLQYLPNGTKTGTDVLTFKILSDHLNFGLRFDLARHTAHYGMLNAVVCPVFLPLQLCRQPRRDDLRRVHPRQRLLAGHRGDAAAGGRRLGLPDHQRQRAATGIHRLHRGNADLGSNPNQRYEGAGVVSNSFSCRTLTPPWL